MTVAERAGELERGLAVPVAGGPAHGQQLVRDLGHGADHDHGLLRKAVVHNARGAVNGGGVLHGRAAKFHDNHAEKTLSRTLTQMNVTQFPDYPVVISPDILAPSA